jgi:GDSL-like Lipase/Acylhydrolase family
MDHRSHEPEAGPRRSWSQIIRTALRLTIALICYVLVFLTVAAASIWLALAVAPMQPVNAAGQSAAVGATMPSLSLRGPGQLDLFGQVMPTRPQFAGPIRPSLALTRITIDPQVVRVLRSDGTRKIELSLSQQLAAGWKRYFVIETIIAAGFALPILAGLASLAAHAGLTRAKAIAAIGVGLIVVIAVNVGGVLLTAYSTPATLRSVRTLDDLVGTSPVPAAQPQDRPQPAIQAVVIGDSTAAGDGLPQAANASPLDHACGRSPDAYANALATVNGWQVLNLACDSATIENGLLGVQVLSDGRVAPAQLTEATGAIHAKVIIISVGADDVQWSVMTQLCVASAICSDKVSAAYFASLLGQFTRAYYELLTQLATLPAKPKVLVNEYYDPFGSSVACLNKYGITSAKAAVLASRLGQLNQVLSQGAQAFGFSVAAPDFAGHELCTQDPWVQGSGDPAPLHPTASGQLAIALADEQALADGQL